MRSSKILSLKVKFISTICNISVFNLLYITGNFSTAVLPCCNPPSCLCDFLPNERMQRDNMINDNDNWATNVITDISVGALAISRNEREISNMLNSKL